MNLLWCLYLIWILGFIFIVFSDAQSIIVGNLQGELSITQGQALYSIPIQLPKGPNKIEPKLNLIYRSQNNLNTILGIGWDLDIFSSISRCSQTLDQDGQIRGINGDNQDQYCLDGQRLIPVPPSSLSLSSEYRSEIDTYTRVRGDGNGTCGGPNIFIANLKNRRQLVYGTTTGSKLSDISDCVYRWSLSEIRDLYNNNVILTYGGSKNELNVISSITYGKAQVKFEYQQRPDPAISYFKGDKLMESIRRMTKISVYNGNGGLLLRNYSFQYDLNGYGGSNDSVLTSLQLCTPIGSCLKPLKFSYGSTLNLTKQFKSNITYTSNYGANTGWGPENPIFIDDVNGDGYADILGFGPLGVNVSLNSGGNSFLPSTYWSNLWGSNTGWRVATHWRFLKDVNGDGLPDLLGVNDNNGVVSINNGSSFEPQIVLGTTISAANGWGPSGAVIFSEDINNDGMADIIAFKNGTAAGTYVSLSQGNNFPPQTLWSTNFGAWPIENPKLLADVNGDRLSDVVGFADDGVYVSINSGSSFLNATRWIVGFGYNSGWRVGSHPRIVADVNGDGLADIVGFFDGGINVSLSTGVNFMQPVVWRNDFGTTNGWRVGFHPRFLVDVTGDGLPDVVGVNGTCVFVAINSGSLFSPGSCWTTNIVANNTPRFVQDISGDSLPDIIAVDTFGVFVAQNLNSRLLLQSTSDSYGSTNSIQYKSLADAKRDGFYSGNSVAKSYPIQSCLAPLQVVINVEEFGALATKQVSKFGYGDFSFSVRGRGSRGFRSVTRTFSNNRTISEDFFQEYPLTGRTKTRKTLFGESSKENTFEYVMSNHPLNPKIIRVWLSKEAKVERDLQGIISVLNITSSYDDYGNVFASTKVTSGDGPSISELSHATYVNDETTWLLGLVDFSSVSYLTPNQPPLHRHVSFEYDTKGSITYMWKQDGDPLELQTSYNYDSFGNQIAKVDFGLAQPGVYQSRKSLTTFDRDGILPISVTNSLDHTETFTYNEFDVMASRTTANNLTTLFRYDSLGREASQSRADGSNTSTRYESAEDADILNARFKVTRNETGKASEITYYDALGRVLRSETRGFRGERIFRDTQYNEYGLKESETKPYVAGNVPFTTLFTYDQLGRIIKKTEGASITVITYSGLKKTTLNPLGREEVKQYNPTGTVKSVLDSNGGTVEYLYDALGKVLRVKDPNGLLLNMSYDSLGHRAVMQDPNMGRWEYKYNSFDELIWQKDAKEQTLVTKYDELGRITSRTDMEGEFRWTYDNCDTGVGKKCEVLGPNYSRRWTYDKYGRENKVSTRVGSLDTKSIATSYDISGKIVSKTYPNNESIYWIYDANGFLQAMDTTNTSLRLRVWTALDYDAAKRCTQETFGTSSIVTQYAFDTAANMKEIKTVNSGGTLRYFQYNYDENHNMVKRTDEVAGTREFFVYDSLDRLILARKLGNQGTHNQFFLYDNAGNILTNSDLGPEDYVYDTNHPYAVVEAGNKEYAYDANGNMVRRSGTNITWTSFNQPSKFLKNGETLTLIYDENRQLLRKEYSDGSSVYFDQAYEERSTQNATVTKLSFAVEDRLVASVSTIQNVSSTKKLFVEFLHTDALGSVDTITDLNERIRARFNYKAFGLRQTLVSDLVAREEHGFTGHTHWDDLNLIFMNGRFYDPEVGRFISPDPFVQDRTDTQSLNRYTYVRNNPLKLVDPSGYFSFGRIFKFVAPIVVAAVSFVALGPVGAAVASSVGLTGTVGAVAAGAIAGAGSGFLSGVTATGDLKGGTQGAIVGALNAGVGASFGSAWSIGRVVATSVTSGIGSELTGGDFIKGFALSAVTSTAEYTYNQLVNYDVTWKGGGSAVQKGYWDPPVAGANNVGIQGGPVETGWFKSNGDFNFGEGGGLSRLANGIPGVNAVAGMHDMFQINLGSARDVLNVLGMPVAAAVTYAGLLNGPEGVSLLVDRSK